MEVENPKSRNNKRSKYISYLKNKNFMLYRNMSEYAKNIIFDNDLAQIVESFKANIFMCSNLSLYSEEPKRKITYIASNTCKNKCCFVCNWNRQKAIRRKYISWFRDNQNLTRVTVKGKNRIVTADQLQKITAPSNLVKVSYDVMHLTLTVPHYSETGFNGDKYYYSRLIQLFNFMRKDEDWLNLVYGGEFGVETTMSQNGLHIHIHALLLVRKKIQNRNELHKFILQKWNHLTINKDSKSEFFKMDAIEKIFKSNSSLTYHDLIPLDRKGATIIGLETIYSIEGGEKVRTTEWNSKEMIYAIMEAISYHFEPHAFNKSDKSIDIPLLIEILPKVKNKILYKKFGCLHRESRLNINYKDEAAKLSAELAEIADLMADELTGEFITDKEYFILNPSHVCHDPENDNNIFLSRKGRKIRKKLKSVTTTQAVSEMSGMVMKSHGKRKN